MLSPTGWVPGIAMALIEGSYLPQVFRLRRMKSADEMSILFPSANFCGRLMGMIYSFRIDQPVLAFGFLAGMLIRAILLGQVVYYRMVARAANRKLDSWIQGAYSRAYLLDQIQHELATLRRAGGTKALVFLELSDLEGDAHRLGLASSELLARAVSAIRPMVRQGDVLAYLEEAGRFGLLLRCTDRREALTAVRRFAGSILSALSSPGGKPPEVVVRIVHLEDQLAHQAHELLTSPGAAVDLSVKDGPDGQTAAGTPVKSTA